MKEPMLPEIIPAATQSNPTPMMLLELAISKGADLEQLTKLMDLQERYDRNEGRKAFNNALAAFKADPPQLVKNKHVKFSTAKGVTEYHHATLDAIVNTVSGPLSAVGLSFRWDIKHDSAKVSVICILQHKMGHYEHVQSPFVSPDESGGKNSIQGVGSVITYLQRYTLLAALGLATEDQDTDALPDGIGNEAVTLINECDSLEQLTRVFKEQYKAAKTKAEMSFIITAKDKRKAELEAK